MEEYHGRERPTSGLAQTRTKQFCEEMSVTKELMATLLHTAGGRGGVSLGAMVSAVNSPAGMATRKGMVGAIADEVTLAEQSGARMLH